MWLESQVPAAQYLESKPTARYLSYVDSLSTLSRESYKFQISDWYEHYGSHRHKDTVYCLWERMTFSAPAVLSAAPPDSSPTGVYEECSVIIAPLKGVIASLRLHMRKVTQNASVWADFKCPVIAPLKGVTGHGLLS